MGRSHSVEGPPADGNTIIEAAEDIALGLEDAMG